MNPLNAFFHPGKTAKDCLAHPNLVVSLALVVLPTLVLVGLAALLRAPISTKPVVDAAKDVVFWIVSTAFLYVLLYLLKGKAVQGKFVGLLSALSLTRLFNAVLVVLSFLVAFLLLPGLFAELKGVQQASSLQDLQAIAQRVPLSSDFFSLGLGFLFLGIGLLLALESLFVWYAVIAATGPGGTLKNLVVLALVLAVVGLFSGYF
ncbi:MAG: hypothetical protein J4203_06045 [Candidatus Diapherotrites archaeon]|nr:hypothetical protein [Candidatus Diapherotrites archaeon]